MGRAEAHTRTLQHEFAELRSSHVSFFHQRPRSSRVSQRALLRSDHQQKSYTLTLQPVSYSLRQNRTTSSLSRHTSRTNPLRPSACTVRHGAFGEERRSRPGLPTDNQGGQREGRGQGEEEDEPPRQTDAVSDLNQLITTQSSQESLIDRGPWGRSAPSCSQSGNGPSSRQCRQHRWGWT